MGATAIRVHVLLCHCRHPSRASSPATASTKSAKRKAAEALLAAQYGGLGSSALTSNRMAAPNGFQRAGYSSDAAAAAAPAQATGPSSKRPKSMLSAAITRLGGHEQQAAEALQAPAAHDLLSAVDVQRQQRQDQELVLRQLQEQRQQRQRMVSEVAGSSWQQAVVAHVSDVYDAAAGQDDLQLHLHSDDSAVGEDDTSRHVQSVEAAGAAAQQLQRPAHAHPEQPVVVPACGPECSHTHSHGWCHSQVGYSGPWWWVEYELRRALTQRVLTQCCIRCWHVGSRVCMECAARSQCLLVIFALKTLRQSRDWVAFLACVSDSHSVLYVLCAVEAAAC